MNYDASKIIRIMPVLFSAAIAVISLCGTAALSDELKPATSQPASESLAIGEMMYRKGILPSGEPMQAYINSDISVPGTSFTCVSCHMRSGLGSVEGGVFTTPTNGKTLYAPRGVAALPERNMAMSKGIAKTEINPPRPPAARPAYTDDTLAAALRGGKDPAGRVLNDSIMPRYNLSDGDMGYLIAYLKSLSNNHSPGVDNKVLRLATITSEDVSSAESAAMLIPMTNFIDNMNGLEKAYRENARKLRTTFDKMPFRRLQLSHWKLKGASDTWGKQLEENYRAEPVFALIGGIVNGTWKPVHDFSEANRIPCILPITNKPVISETDWYTLYLSKGYYQEGEGAARYANSLKNISNDSRIVQIVRSTHEGEALSSGFIKTWQELGHKAPHTITIKADEPLTREHLQAILKKEQPAVLMLWSGPEDLPILENAAISPHAPSAVFISSGYFGKGIWSINEQARPTTYITYPYRTPQDETKYATDINRLKLLNNIKDDQLTTLIKTYYALGVMSQAIKSMGDNYYRDYLLDVISMQSDIESPLYERVSFGPNQRYVSKGCYVVQLSKGSTPELIKMSEWVQH